MKKIKLFLLIPLISEGDYEGISEIYVLFLRLRNSKRKKSPFYLLYTIYYVVYTIYAKVVGCGLPISFRTSILILLYLNSLPEPYISYIIHLVKIALRRSRNLMIFSKRFASARGQVKFLIPYLKPFLYRETL